MHTQDVRNMRDLETSTMGKSTKRKKKVSILVPPPIVVMSFEKKKRKGNKHA
jgi:hypothetical protein